MDPVCSIKSYCVLNSVNEPSMKPDEYIRFHECKLLLLHLVREAVLADPVYEGVRLPFAKYMLKLPLLKAVHIEYALVPDIATSFKTEFTFP